MSDDAHLLHEIVRELREIVRLLKRRGYDEVRRIDMVISVFTVQVTEVS